MRALPENTHTLTLTHKGEDGEHRSLPDRDNGLLTLVKGREAMVGTRAADNLKEKKVVVVTGRQDTALRQQRDKHMGERWRGETTERQVRWAEE